MVLVVVVAVDPHVVVIELGARRLVEGDADARDAREADGVEAALVVGVGVGALDVALAVPLPVVVAVDVVDVAVLSVDVVMIGVVITTSSSLVLLVAIAASLPLVAADAALPLRAGASRSCFASTSQRQHAWIPMGSLQNPMEIMEIPDP